MMLQGTEVVPACLLHNAATLLLRMLLITEQVLRPMTTHTARHRPCADLDHHLDANAACHSAPSQDGSICWVRCTEPFHHMQGKKHSLLSAVHHNRSCWLADTSRALAPGRYRQRLRNAEASHDAKRHSQLMPVVCLVQHQGRVDGLLELGPARHAHGARPELVSE